MRSLWPLVAGILLAWLVTLVTMPIAAGVAVLMALAKGRAAESRTEMAGMSSFSIRDDQGRFLVGYSNTSFGIISVPLVGEPRPRRLMVRMTHRVEENGEGVVGLDAWPMGAPSEFRRSPTYSIRAQASSVQMGDDAILWTDRAGRKTAYSLVDGNRLFDADLPLLSFVFEPEARRLAALSVADEEYAAKGGVAVISYGAPGRTIRRVLLLADDVGRAKTLRATISATRLVTYTEEQGGARVIELPLASGPVRIPVTPNDLDFMRARTPSGLRLVPIQAWG